MPTHALLRPTLRRLLWRHSGGAVNSGSAASSGCSCSLAARFSTSSTSTSEGTSTSSPTPTDTSFRRGFGAKVALPGTDVLGRVLVREPATITFRAYHLGSRIHVGKVLALLDERSKAVTTTSGKDYAILWLGDSSARLFAGQHEPHHPQQQQLAPWQRWQQQQQQQPSSITSVAAHLSSLAQMVKAWQHQQQQPLPSWQLPTHQQPGWPQHHHHQQQQQQSPQAVPRLMVIYRVGSVVFAGTEQGEEARLLAAMVPPGVCYSAGHSPWTAAADVAGSRRVQAAEEHTVVVNPSLTEEARKGMDQVQLRVLDVGAVRVLTSVLAQSAALAFYERSVNASLEHLSEWRAATGLRARPQSGVSRLLSGLWAKQQDTVLFKVIAAAALVIEESRRLLDVAEPAWYFDRYNVIWGVMAAEFELEQRFHSLELKLNQVEKEAKHDVKDSVARRYHKLERSVVWLLVASCLLAAFDASKKVFLSKSSSSSSSSGGGSSDDGLHDDGSSTSGSSESTLDNQPAAVSVGSG